MENTFAIKRFWKYLRYDIIMASQRIGLSLLVLCLTPLIFFIATEIVALISTHHLIEGTSVLSYASLILSLFVIQITFPVKLYGELTEKKAGSNYLMLPASVMEKFISMMVVSLVILPLVFCVGFFSVESLVSLFPGFGKPILLQGASAIDWLLGIMADADFHFNFHVTLSSYLGFIQCTMAFILGAICFRRSKAARTILVGFAVSAVLSSLVFFVVSTFGFDIAQSLENFLERATNTDIQMWYNIVGIVWNLLITGAFMCAIYFRLKTLKH